MVKGSPRFKPFIALTLTALKLIIVSFVQKDLMARIKPHKNGTKKDLITQKAAALFRLKGYSSASMRHLAEEVGVEAPSLYNHIGSKSEILQAICFKVANSFTFYLDSIDFKHAKSTTLLESIIRFHIKMMLTSFNEVYVANHEWKHLKEPYLSNFLMQRRAYEKRLMEIMEAGMQAGELKKTNAYLSVLTILSAVRGLEFLPARKKDISNTQLENNMVNHLLKGIIK